MEKQRRANLIGAKEKEFRKYEKWIWWSILKAICIKEQIQIKKTFNCFVHRQPKLSWSIQLKQQYIFPEAARWHKSRFLSAADGSGQKHSKRLKKSSKCGWSRNDKSSWAELKVVKVVDVPGK